MLKVNINPILLSLAHLRCHAPRGVSRFGSGLPPTPPEFVGGVVRELRASFDAGITTSYDWRVSQLRALDRLLDEGRDELCEMFRDVHKDPFEGYLQEISCVEPKSLPQSSISRTDGRRGKEYQPIKRTSIVMHPKRAAWSSTGTRSLELQRAIDAAAAYRRNSCGKCRSSETRKLFAGQWRCDRAADTPFHGFQVRQMCD